MRRIFLIWSCIFFTASSIFGQVGIGTENPDKSAILDITSNNMGVMFPRVALKSSTDDQTVKNPATGLLVYNLGTESSFRVEGFLFWNGSEWRRFTDGNTLNPEITQLMGGTAVLFPSTYKQSTTEPYIGTLKISYTGGNGASYGGGQTFTTVNGLTCTLQPGTLEYGNGEVTFAVTGYPTVSSPTTTTFTDLEFLTKPAGPVTVGRAGARVDTRTHMGAMIATADGNGAEFTVSTLDDRYEIRFYADKNKNLTETDIEMRIKAGAGITTDNLILMHTYEWTQIDPNTGLADYGKGLNYNNEFYYVGNYSSAAQSWNNYQISTAWKTNGDPAVYYQGAPEYHQMIFTSTDQEVKRMYRYTLFFGAPNTNFSSYDQTKCWIHAEEIIAEE